MSPDYLAIGDTVADSPVGHGTITGITEAGYPQVNHIAVARLTRTDGVVFDPYGSYAKEASKAPPKTAQALTGGPLPHEWDDDACCVHCGYDGAEAAHLVKFCGYEKTDADRYCERRAATSVTTDGETK